MAEQQFRFIRRNQFIVDGHFKHGLIDALAVVWQDFKRSLMVDHHLSLRLDSSYLFSRQEDRHTAITLRVTEQFVCPHDTFGIVSEHGLYLTIRFIRIGTRFRVHIQFVLLFLQPVTLSSERGIRRKESRFEERVRIRERRVAQRMYDTRQCRHDFSVDFRLRHKLTLIRHNAVGRDRVGRTRDCE